MNDVGAWLAACPREAMPAIEALRAVVRTAGPDLVEGIKWNAPSYAQDGADRITLGLEKNGGVRIVLHRGAGNEVAGFSFEDPAQLARWPAPDRGVLTFRSAAEVEAQRNLLTDLLTRWLEATR